MSRPRRHSPGGMVFHVLNRGVGRRLLLTKDEDFLAFERFVEETLRARRMRLCAYCLMPNHWHFVVWPEPDGDLPAFMQQVTNTHVKRWKEDRHEIAWRRCVAASIAVGPSAILTGSRTRPSDWGSNARFGPVEDRRNNRRLATVSGRCLLSSPVFSKFGGCLLFFPKK